MILEWIREMFFTLGLPGVFWAKAMNTTCYLINRCPSFTINFKTPLKKWSGSFASYMNSRVFGCVAYAHTNQGKLEP